MGNSDRNIKDLVETLKQGQAHNRKCTLLVGAGCSVTAGIPLASGFVEYIREHHSAAYDRAEKKTYPYLMGQLGIGQRRDLIARYVDNARINWEHIAIAQLVAAGFADRVLTTNFDQLIVRACALVGVFPAVYDFAASQVFKPHDIPEQSVFHLHGQRSGFKLLNTEEEMQSLSKDLKPVIEDSVNGRTCLVVGYSGENDPVFEQLSRFGCFEHNLYWATYKDNSPGSHVTEKLLVDGKQAYLLSGYDASELLVTLAQELDCFPPDLVGKPFSHLKGLFEMLTPFTPPGGQTEFNPAEDAKNQVEKAIQQYEEGAGRGESSDDALDKSDKLALEANSLLMAGDYEGVIRLLPPEIAQEHDELLGVLSWAYFNLGNGLMEQAKTKVGEESDLLYKQTYEKFAEAVKTKPDKHEAFNNWGIALFEQAKTKAGEEADQLYEQAYEKYAEAVKVKPDKHEAFNNWGMALQLQAETKEGKEADQLYEQAYEKYAAAVKIKLDLHEAYYRWGYGLDEQAKTKAGEEADRLYEQAYEKYAEAVKIKPDMHEAFNSWGIALRHQAETKVGGEADRLYEQAYEKYAKAVKIKSDKHEAFNNWGSALIWQAKTKMGDEAERLFHQAREKCKHANEFKPGRGSYNLACIAALLGEKDTARQELEHSRDTGHLPTKEHLLADTDLDSLRDEKWFQEFMESLG